MTQTAPLILVDGSSYLYRAYHAMPPLTNSDGESTGTIYGVINMLRKLIRDYHPEHMAVVFDAKGKTFRNDLYAEYKATRPPMPDDLREQIAPIHEIVKAMGLPLLCIDNVEADDVIGTLAKQATAAGIETVISTGDKDMAQLVSEHVTLVNTMNNSKTDIAAVKEKFGLTPQQIVDYLALMGDKVDNIPGVDSVGPKTATKLLQQYGSLQGVIEHADEVKGKLGEKLRAAVDALPLSYQLATIKMDVELDFTPETLDMQAADNQKLAELYRRYEFKSWLQELDSAPVAAASTKTDEPATSNETYYETILTQQQLDKWLARLKKAELFAFDTETTSLNYLQARIVGMSFAIQAGEAAYLPLAHDYPGAPQQLDFDATLALIKPLLEDPKALKVGQNLKYDRHILLNHGIDLQGIAHDTMLQSYVLDSTATRHDMDSLAEKYLNRSTIHFEDIAGKGKKQLTFNEIGLEEAAPYACEDADITLQLHHILWPKVQAIPSLEKVYRELEMPLLPVLNTLERNGVHIDIFMLQQQSDALAHDIDRLEKEAHVSAGTKFNLGSPKQLQEILYDQQQLPVRKKTPKGQPSTAENVLQELADDGYELPQIIMNYRSLSKLKSTYTDKLPQQVNQQTGRVHTSYHQAVTATGRLSSSDPNLQNIPIRTETGRKIREAFVAGKGAKILAADYSQIELRIMAHLSGDKSLLTAFAEGEDIHRHTASEIFGVEPENVTGDQRRSAKAINFGLIYGMSAHGLSKQLGIERHQAAKYMETYFERYPGVRNYMDNTREQAKKDGYVETIFGRRLYLPEINSSNGLRRQYAERTAINAPMQGSAADIIKRAMISIHDWLLEADTGIRMIMQVHDELVFEVPEDQLDLAKTEIEQFMIKAAELAVPLEVGIGVGDNWEQAH
ncbi:MULTISPECIES: DNA polymerase I [unclassified Methylophaga]|jgi:DNA polymerase-1|uniref:DNA polymerase I n=3 Tax=Methylophaga TaxID=40222 RepID=UPI000C9831C1|nr:MULTISPECIES: DNA polymerase I [unclassified Methylophaga]MAK67349.1 DNA polymerase I [Methylophaga sp.]MAY16888.1 DNA polymerase I [Methylophaga sp.]|tara:strand:- start:14901 stop:17615 length:2715 start_codon:yes stop_codon:yes gene_type:complete